METAAERRDPLSGSGAQEAARREPYVAWSCHVGHQE